MWDTDTCEQSGDAQLFIAALESFQTGKLTPLLKEELRCQIQSRRLSEGKDELVVSFDSDPKPPQVGRYFIVLHCLNNIVKLNGMI